MQFNVFSETVRDLIFPKNRIYYMLIVSQGDQGFPGEHGHPGERGVGEPGPKVKCTPF